MISWKSLWQKITLLVDTKLAMSQQCAFVENKKVKHIKSSVRQSTSCRWREVILSLYSSGVLGPVLGSPVQVSHQKTGASPTKGLIDEKVTEVRQEAMDRGEKYKKFNLNIGER